MVTCVAALFAVERAQGAARVSDLEVRIAAFAWLRERGAANGGVLSGNGAQRGIHLRGSAHHVERRSRHLVSAGLLDSYFNHHVASAAPTTMTIRQ